MTTPIDPSEPTDALTNPIPIATQATSHVDTIFPSPPHPNHSFSPVDKIESPPTAALDPYDSNLAESEDDVPLAHTKAAAQKKAHPADLVSLTNPDPHASVPAGTPTSEIASPLSSPGIERDYEKDDSRRKQSLSGTTSENGVTVGHGSEYEEESDRSPTTTTTSHAVNGHSTTPPALQETTQSPMTTSTSAPTTILPTPIIASTSTNHQPPDEGYTNNTPDDETVEALNPQAQSLAKPVPPPPAASSSSSGEARKKENGGGSSERRREREREKEKEKERESRSRKQLGEWAMTKTLGAGSMGKVKLGTSGITGEKVAIKIIPRFTSTAAAYRPPSSSSKDGDKEKEKVEPPPKPTASFLAKAAAKDASKEVRTMREGSICLLLHHPYVCGMKSMVLYPNHYYMVFEYVNGGQMLDYIISHGRLRERSARKFARQIGSALEYCHANSIVHRDLKIENILISKTGNIKIIDFGLSNLYSPVNHLSTFCGSLYFAAPELLNAKPYTGPEVDVWSYGIVLYVLVCGKVPFDDQSMPALHAKIKRGQVEYPAWLSAECKHLLSRMLVTVPSQRATLTEVLNHPWMVKGFAGPPSPHLPPRVPLKPEEIDRDVIKGMVGFEFGTDIEIEEKLMEVLHSDLYRTAIRGWEARKAGTGADGDPEEKLSERPATRVDGKDMKGLGRSPTNKRFSGLGFYGKKIAGGFNAAFASTGKTSDGGSDNLSNGSTATLTGGGLRLDQLDPTRGFHPLISIYYLVKEKIEREKIWGPGVFASSTLSLTGPPPPPAPALAYQSGTGIAPPRTVELAKPAASGDPDSASARQPIASPLIPMTPQPRARATGEEYPSHPPTAPPASRAAEYRSSFSADKRSSYHPPSTPTSGAPQSFARPVSSYEPASPTPNRRSIHVTTPTAADRGETSGSEDIPLGSPSQGGFARRFGSLLGRSAPSPDGSFVKGHRQRASIGGTAHRVSNKTAVSALPQVTETLLHSGGSDVPLPSPPQGQPVNRASTIGELSPSRHQRGQSMGGSPTSAATLGRASGSMISERRRQVSLGATARSARPRTTEEGAAFDERAEELAMAEDEAQAQAHQQDVGFVGRTAPSGGATESAKPVWLKGLFSVSTTSTKPTTVIRADLIKVLDRLGVQHRDVKSGFECAHVPSIDLSSVGSSKKQEKGTIKRKTSKLHFGKDTAPDDSQVSLSGNEARERGRAASSTSFTVLSPHGDEPSTSLASPTMVKSPTQDRFNSSTAEGSTVSNELIVRFEVFIVKMPLLPGIHGLQFRRIGGNAWQYQMLARRVLQELKL